MLGVIGDSTITVSTAAYAAANVGEPVALLSASSPAEYRVRRADGLETVVSLRDASAADEAEAFLVVAEGSALREHLAPWRDRLADRPLLLVPGNLGGVGTVHAWFREWGLTPPRLAEVPGYPAVASVEASAIVIRAVKEKLPCGASEPAAALVDVFRAWLPELVVATPLETGLANTNHVIHPPLVLVNATAIDRGEQLRFYREGLSTAGCELIESVDAERLAITDALGLERRSVTDWMRRYYGAQGMTGSDLRELLLGFPGFEESLAPTTLRYRYLDEDLVYGLAPLEAVGRMVGVPTPQLTAVLTAASGLTGADYRVHAVARARAALVGAPDPART